MSVLARHSRAGEYHRRNAMTERTIITVMYFVWEGEGNENKITVHNQTAVESYDEGCRLAATLRRFLPELRPAATRIHIEIVVSMSQNRT
jgi:hypothetical protein